MFQKEELDIIFQVFSELETDNESINHLKAKMEILNKQRKIGDKANEEIMKLQDELVKLEKKEEEV